VGEDLSEVRKEKELSKIKEQEDPEDRIKKDIVLKRCKNKQARYE
jgi:hypothetical protein